MTSQLVKGDKVLIIAGPFQGKKAAFLSHRGHSVEVRLNPGEESKFLNPGVVFPIRDNSPERPRQVAKATQSRPKPDDTTTITESTYASGFDSARETDPGIETIQKLIDVQADKVQHDLELMSSLITSLNVARRQSASAKPWDGPV